jgi:hypothetical protein
MIRPISWLVLYCKKKNEVVCLEFNVVLSFDITAGSGEEPTIYRNEGVANVHKDADPTWITAGMLYKQRFIQSPPKHGAYDEFFNVSSVT